MLGFGQDKPEPKKALQPTEIEMALFLRTEELAKRLLGLEQAVIQTLNLLNFHIEQTKANEAHLHKDFEKLVAYVMSPSRTIMGDGQERN